ncbi:Cephalotocin receptor 2 [Mizuhopecten yessoensis]|uniref:Cephalotocin receptor 2 n=1 Tax=Mizuhopecten yessoensis TaxID=6573 RepID=A0A210QKM7_MIZYE|nr:Cephalotocin receptor 2 [Mizuhopecten yessoensis]
MDTNVSMNVPPLSVIELQDYIENDIPVTVYLAILSIIGTIGNAHAIFVYFLRYKSSNHRTFIVWLAVVDFIACCFSIPFELFDIRFSCTFTIDGLCRFFRYLNHFVSIYSGSLLGVISVERFRKACRPFGRQLEGNGAMIACVVTVAVSAVISTPALVMYGVQIEIVDDRYGINGTDCKVLDTFKDSIVYKGFNLLLLLICTIVFIVCVIIYIFIGRVLCRQYKFRSSFQIKKSIPTVSSEVNHAMHEDESSLGKTAMTRTRIFNQTLKVKQKNPKRFDRSKQITFMFLVATGVSYLGYLPYLALTIIKAVTKNFSVVINSVLGPFDDILLRGYFISNVTNPLVYCFLDDKFRGECKMLYKALWARIGKCCKRS